VSETHVHVRSRRVAPVTPFLQSDSGGPARSRILRNGPSTEWRPAESNYVTELARGDINAADELFVELIKPADMPAMIRITWPPQPTVVQPARFADTASFIVRLFARASTELTRIRARRL
jgi:hypothetical protein